MIAIVCAGLIGLGVILQMAARTGHGERKVSYSRFLAQVEAGEIASVAIADRNSGASPAICTLKGGGVEGTVLPSGYRLAMKTMREHAVNIDIEGSSPELVDLLINSSPFLLLLAFWIFMMRQMRKPRA